MKTYYNKLYIITILVLSALNSAVGQTTPIQAKWVIEPKGGVMVMKNGNWVTEARDATGELSLEMTSAGKPIKFYYIIKGIDKCNGNVCYKIDNDRSFYLANESGYPALKELSQNATVISADTANADTLWKAWCDETDRSISAQLLILKSGSEDEKLEALAIVGALIHPAIDKELIILANDKSEKVASLAKAIVDKRNP